MRGDRYAYLPVIGFQIAAAAEPCLRYSTVTLLARLRGWSTCAPRFTAM